MRLNLIKSYLRLIVRIETLFPSETIASNAMNSASILRLSSVFGIGVEKIACNVLLCLAFNVFIQIDFHYLSFPSPSYKSDMIF
ncbi:hypothetical protein XBFFL1_2560055 [Xenorhabdus bovienii str. feltiae Florida]|nr:hypothetical protein XBFFR1_900056 [Xenorhabdus bovienii str. feltiae France]CDG93599.1 hypothetical protein XBFFL1_2560055 [Xenorhabdus bovienii str. feltiae Florida]